MGPASHALPGGGSRTTIWDSPAAMRRPLVVAALAAVLAAVPASVASAAPPTIGGCPVFPASNAWNRDISRAPVDPPQSPLRRGHRPRAEAASGLRRRRRLRDPADDRPAVPAARTDHVHGGTRRVRSRPLPGAARRARGRRVGPPRARRAARDLQALRAVRRPALRRRLGGRLGCGVRPAHRHAAAEGLDVGRRRRAADRAGSRAARRGVRSHRARAAGHRAALRAAAFRRGRRRHFGGSSSSDPNLPPMGLRLRLKRSYSLRGFGTGTGRA